MGFGHWKGNASSPSGRDVEVTCDLAKVVSPVRSRSSAPKIQGVNTAKVWRVLGKASKIFRLRAMITLHSVGGEGVLGFFNRLSPSPPPFDPAISETRDGEKADDLLPESLCPQSIVVMHRSCKPETSVRFWVGALDNS